MQRERRIDEIEGADRQIEMLQVGVSVCDGVVRRHGTGARQHVLRDVDAEHLPRPRRARPAAEPAEAAAEIEHVGPREIRQHRPQRRPFRGAVETLDRAAEPAVAGEEFVVVVDVLGHGALLAPDASGVKPVA